jgi:hypothetical protein
MFWFDLPRLSADIGLNYIGSAERQTQNMWVFEPDFVSNPENIIENQTINSITSKLASTPEQSDVRLRPDIFAQPLIDLSLQPAHQALDMGRRSTMLIELKRPGEMIGSAHQTQVWDYVRELIRTGAIKPHEPVDCYVIGGKIDDDDGGPRTEGWHQNVRIISCTYEQLIARAKRLTLNLYNDLLHTPAMAPEARIRDGAPDEVAPTQDEDTGVQPSEGHRDKAHDSRRDDLHFVRDDHADGDENAEHARHAAE